ncbi:MAG: hypothetical protein LPJ89_10200 [Hymenobacteraceae bacterium]|nr:hypothetical protein [Hymenobacteraceae bacterium]MDX5395532.1 hypothetical protein [Hymenobacteraceae bacterium]MDX5444140.1 hypothetical protein [Hymenobacteraceae bacterium]MDX5511586.1 hypothetical protein [Hymenobacteraceae bacterium]
MAMSFDNLRKGRRYQLINLGESFEFQVEEVLSDEDYLLKDLQTLERYRLQELLQYGKGKDFDLIEL